MIFGKDKKSEGVVVTWMWGEAPLESVHLRDRTTHTFITDGSAAFPLVKVELRGNQVVITPRCLMVAGDSAALRRYADILEGK